MRSFRTSSMLAAIVLAAGALTSVAQAQVGTAISYQGQLKNAGQVVNTDTDMKFTLYDSPAGNVTVSPTVEILKVKVANGLFTANPDFGFNPYTSNQALWLQIDVRNPAGSGSYVPMGSRQKLTPAPFSLATRGVRVDPVGNVKIAGDDNTIQQAILQLDSGKGATQQYAAIDFFDRGAPQWGVGKLPNNDFYIDNYAGDGLTIRHSDGNVGIGTDAPFWKLTVGTHANDRGLVHVNIDDNVAVGTHVSSDAGYFGTFTPNRLKFFTNSDPYGDPGIMLELNGNVGIGTNTANYKLDVNGPGRFMSDSDYALRATRSDGTGIGIATTGFATYVESLTEKTLALNASPTVNGASIWISPTANRIGFGNGNSNPTEVMDVKGNIKIRSGDRIYFGLPNENTDPIYFQRSNQSTTPNVSTLRLIIGDDAGGGSQDSFDICREGNTTVYSFQSDGNAFKPGGGSWAALCDERSKDDVQPLTGTLDRLLKLKGHSYTYKPEYVESGRALPGTQIGLVAQEVETVFPDWVTTGPEGLKVVTERSTTALMVEAMRDLRNEKDAEISTLKARLEKLEALVAAQTAAK